MAATNFSLKRKNFKKHYEICISMPAVIYKFNNQNIRLEITLNLWAMFLFRFVLNLRRHVVKKFMIVTKVLRSNQFPMLLLWR